MPINRPPVSTTPLNTGVFLIVATVLIAAGGCEHPVIQALHPANIAHELRPHRLWRKNQNRPLSENAYFSVRPSARDQIGRSGGEQFIGDRHAE